MISAPPSESRLVRDALDAAMAFAIFDAPVSLVFFGAAVELAKGEHIDDSGIDLTKICQGLVELGVGPLLMDADALDRLGIASVSAPFARMEATDLGSLLEYHDTILSFR